MIPPGTTGREVRPGSAPDRTRSRLCGLQATLGTFPAYQAIDRREADESVDDGTEGVLVAEVTGAGDRGHEVEVGQAYQTPIESSNHQEQGGDVIELFND